MKNLLLITFFVLLTNLVSAQGNVMVFQSGNSKKSAKKERIEHMMRQAEEGVLVFNKQNIFGIQGKSLGYGLFYERGKMRTNRKTSLYRIDLTEIKSLKQEKYQSSSGSYLFYGSPFVYGKVNNFYQLGLSYGQQRMLGQKGNRNGVAVSAVYSGGLSLGFLKPYYLQVMDPATNSPKYIKYSTADSALFLGNRIMGPGGLSRGWKELQFRPGAQAKAALRFDYGRFNDVVSGIEIGLSAEFFSQKIVIMAAQDKNKQLFMQGYIALLFGHRK